MLWAGCLDKPQLACLAWAERKTAWWPGQSDDCLNLAELALPAEGQRLNPDLLQQMDSW